MVSDPFDSLCSHKCFILYFCVNIAHILMWRISINILILSAFPEEQDYYKKMLHPHTPLKIGFIEIISCQTDSATIYLATTGMGTINISKGSDTIVYFKNNTSVIPSLNYVLWAPR